MKTCQCEHGSHERTCGGEHQVEWKTIWGTYKVCNYCHNHHRPTEDNFIDSVGYSEGDGYDLLHMLKVRFG